MKFKTSKILNQILSTSLAALVISGAVFSNGNTVKAADPEPGHVPLFTKQTSSGSYTVAESGYYIIEAAGGKGSDYNGNQGGYGRYTKTAYYLKAGQNLTWTIAYGGAGTHSSGGNAVVVKCGSTELVTAAGGGGAGRSANGGNADATNCGGSTSFQATASGSGGGGGHNGGLGFVSNTHTHTESCKEYGQAIICANPATQGGSYGWYHQTSEALQEIDYLYPTKVMDVDVNYFRKNTHNTNNGCTETHANGARVSIYGDGEVGYIARTSQLYLYRSGNANATAWIPEHTHGVNQISHASCLSPFDSNAYIRSEASFWGRDFVYTCGHAGEVLGMDPGTGGKSYINTTVSNSNIKYLKGFTDFSTTANVAEQAYFSLTKVMYILDVNMYLDGVAYATGLSDVHFDTSIDSNVVDTQTTDWCGYVNYGQTVTLGNLNYDSNKYKLLTKVPTLTKKVTSDSEIAIKFGTMKHNLNVEVYVEDYGYYDEEIKYKLIRLYDKNFVNYSFGLSLNGGTEDWSLNSYSSDLLYGTTYSVTANNVEGYTTYTQVNEGSRSSSKLTRTGTITSGTTIKIIYREKVYKLTVDPNGGEIYGSTDPITSDTYLAYKKGFWNNISGYRPTKTGYNLIGFKKGSVLVYNKDCNWVESAYFSQGLYQKRANLKVVAQWERKKLNLDINPDFNLYGANYQSGARVKSFNLKIDNPAASDVTLTAIEDYCNNNGEYEATYNITNIKYRTGYKFKSFTYRSDENILEESNLTIDSQNSTSATFRHYVDQPVWFSINTQPIQYTIVYNGNKPAGASSELTGSTASSTHYYDEAKALTANSYKIVGWTFDRWDTKPDGTGDSFADKEVVKNLTSTDGSTITLYAQWKRNCYYVKYVKGLTNGGGSTARSEHLYDADVTLNANGFTGRTYKITFDGNRPVIDGVPTIGTVQGLPATLSGSLAFNKWKVVATYNSGSYAANKNLGVKNFEKVNGKEATATAQWKNKTVSWTDPTLVGYDFGGWLRSSDAKLVNENSKTIIPDTTKFTEGYQAKWIPRDDTVYKVRHWKEKVNATSTTHNSTNYELYETETFIGTSDTYVTPAVKNYEGFTSPKAITTRIEADGSRVVDYYYDRWRMSLNIDAEYMKTHYDTSDNICTFDVYINGKRVVDDVTEYINDKIPWGSVWEIKDIKPVPGKHYSGTNVDTENIDITATYDD